jgi:uncharacterized CHY-type Zn-finger protein
MASPNDRSSAGESAVGICSTCGRIVPFAANVSNTRCGVCNTPVNRACTGAVGTRFQGLYKVGEGVVPTQPR